MNDSSLALYFEQGPKFFSKYDASFFFPELPINIMDEHEDCYLTGWPDITCTAPGQWTYSVEIEQTA